MPSKRKTSARPKMPPDGRLAYSSDEAGALIGCTGQTVRRMIRRGDLNGVKSGSNGRNRVLVSRAELDEYLVKGPRTKRTED